jgi:16S rRNA processing protein RimM
MGRPPSRPGRETAAPALPEGLVPLGEFGRAHGLKGEVRVKSFTEDPVAIGSYGPLLLEDGRTVVLQGVRPVPGTPDMVLARVEGIASREAAEALNRRRLLVPRDRLPPPEDEDEYLAADLVGLAVETASGERIGTVVAVPNFGGGDLLEIRPPRGPTGLLPFTKAFVPVVDVKGGRVVVEAPADLFEPARPGPDKST